MRRVLLALAVLSLGLSPPASATVPAPTITALSNRADLVSGGDVLVKVTAPAGAMVLSLTANGKAVALKADRVLVTGLPLGASTLKAVPSNGSTATLEVTNHPNGGPVFSGPQVQPWTCNTALIGLGPPVDKQCSTKAVITFNYFDVVTQHFSSYDPAAPPAAVRMTTTTTDEGRTVPFVVRVESGVMDRGLYQVATLVDGWTTSWPRRSAARATRGTSRSRSTPAPTSSPRRCSRSSTPRSSARASWSPTTPWGTWGPTATTWSRRRR